MKSQKLNKNKQTKRVNKTKKNNKNKKIKTHQRKHMKGGVKCVIKVLLQQKPETVIIINLEDNENYESFIEKLKHECLIRYNLHLSKLYNNIDHSKIEINKVNFYEYCDKEIIAITIKNFIEPNGIRIDDFKIDMGRDRDVCQNIVYLSALKPVATFTSGFSTHTLGGENEKNVLIFYWSKFSDDEKKKIIKHFTVCNRFKGGEAMKNPVPKLDINVNTDTNDVIFYSPEHFQYLCDLFNYSLQKGFDKINGTMETSEDKLFIYLAFGDLLHPVIKEIINQDTNYELIKKQVITVKGGNKTCEDVVNEYKRHYNIE